MTFDKNNNDSDNSGDDRPNKPDRNGNQPPPPNTAMNRNFGWWVILVLILVGAIVMFSNNDGKSQSTYWSDLKARIEQGQVSEIEVKDERIVAKLNEGVPMRPESGELVIDISPISRDVYLEMLYKDFPDLKVKESPGDSFFVNFLIHFGPWILFLAFLWFVLFRSIRGVGGGSGFLGNFGRSRHKMYDKEMTNVTLANVAGITEAKDEVTEIIEFLRSPKKFQRLGGRIPRGVLLVGAPGCGKTLLAKAVAGEAEVPFFSISGSDFVEMFVGVGASRVRDLFKQAKDNSPCIIFLDEIDAVGRRRGSGFASGGHDEREQTLNAILVEMDGFETNDQVIVMAATNRSDVLDPALTRPGRFDRQITVPMPDIRGRFEILGVHAKKVKMAPNVDLEKLARGTPMFSGADLEAIINEAAIAATIANKDFVEQEELEEARDKVKWGRSRKSRVISDREKETIAYHEAGHAILMVLLEDSDPLHKVSILPRGQALGVTFQLPEEDRMLMTRRQSEAMIKTLFGGRIAEELFLADISSGASDDIRRATDLARSMVTEWGMSSKIGPIRYSVDENKNPWEQPDKLYSDETADEIDNEIHRVVDESYKEATRLIEENRAHVEAIAQGLLKYETLSAEDVDRIMKGEQTAKPTISDLLQAEAAKQAAKPDPTDTSADESSELDGNLPSTPSPA